MESRIQFHVPGISKGLSAIRVQHDGQAACADAAANVIGIHVHDVRDHVSVTCKICNGAVAGSGKRSICVIGFRFAAAGGEGQDKDGTK